jgi:hypothetical protein
LKSLDAFEGLLFLTTNRVTTFDPAALSRVTLAIRYPALDDKVRNNLPNARDGVSTVGSVNDFTCTNY